MARAGMTISDAAHEWVREMNAYPQEMIETLMQTKMWSGSATVLTPRFGSEITKRFTGSISRMRFQTSRRTWDLNFRRQEDG